MINKLGPLPGDCRNCGNQREPLGAIGGGSLRAPTVFSLLSTSINDGDTIAAAGQSFDFCVTFNEPVDVNTLPFRIPQFANDGQTPSLNSPWVVDPNDPNTYCTTPNADVYSASGSTVNIDFSNTVAADGDTLSQDEIVIYTVT